MALYKSLLGIHNAYAIGSPPTAMMLEFGPPKADKGSLRRLRIDLGGDGRMSGAEVLVYDRFALVPAVTMELTGLVVTPARSCSTRPTRFKTSYRRTCQHKTSGRSYKKCGLASDAEQAPRIPSSLPSPFKKSLFLVVISLPSRQRRLFLVV